MRPFDRHVKQPITVRFVQRHVPVRGNVTTIPDRVCNTRVCETLGRILKILCCEL